MDDSHRALVDRSKKSLGQETGGSGEDGDKPQTPIPGLGKGPSQLQLLLPDGKAGTWLTDYLLFFFLIKRNQNFEVKHLNF